MAEDHPISIEGQLDLLSKCVMGMCAIMRTDPDLSATQHMDLGFIHGQLIKLRKRYATEAENTEQEVADL